jgi:Zn-dependent protease with chaperone function
MLQVLLILMFAAMHLADEVSSWRAVHLGAAATGLLAIGPLAMLALLLAAVCRYAGAAMDRSGHGGAYLRADAIAARMRVGGLVWYIGALVSGGWAAEAHRIAKGTILIGEILIVAPAVCYLAALWWCVFPLEARIREALLFRRIEEGQPIYEQPTRTQYVWGQVKHQVLLIIAPILLISLWDEAIAIADAKLTAPSWRACLEPARWVGVVLAMITAPMLLKSLWSTVRITNGPLVDRTLAMCQRYRVRIRGPYLWRTHGAMVNGAVLGAVWPLRYLLLTDALIERLEPLQLEGVLAHEVAHVKKRHLVWLAISVVASVLTAGWACSFAAYMLRIDAQDDRVGMAASIASLAVAVLVFGFVSRRFEWQADAFAAMHLSVVRDSQEVTAAAAYAMDSALGRVAQLNGISAGAFSWRHGSIAERQSRLRALVGSNIGRMPIDRTVRVIQWLSVVALVGSAVPLLMEWLG